MNPGGYETGDVSHVGQKERANFVGNFAETLEVDYARVRAGTGQDHSRLLTQGDLADLIVVDVAIRPYAVMSEIVEPPGEVELRAVREVSAVREIHRKNFLARFDQGGVRSLVGLTPGMRLNVDVIRTEELLRPLDGEHFYFIDLLAATVVSLAGVALGVFVREDRALSRQNPRRCEVLAGYELDGGSLALQLAIKSALDFGIHYFSIRADQDLPPL
jgi:hypothetical protein